jgi:hypothetical protein
MSIVRRCSQACLVHLLFAVPLLAQTPAPAPAPPAAPARPAPPAPAAPSVRVPAAPRARLVPLAPRAEAAAPANTALRALSLVLLSGEMTGPPVDDSVPMSVRKALDELRDFLPFKSYKLYDTGMVGMPSPTLPAVGRLRGAAVRGQEPQLFEVVVAKPGNSPSLDVSLRDLAPSQATRAGAISNAQGGADVMAASIRVNAGESVVVGTSRVRGDTALVLVITGMSTPAQEAGRQSQGRTLVFPDGKQPFVGSSDPGRSRFRDLLQPPQPPQPAAQPPQPTIQPPQPPQQPLPRLAPLRAPVRPVPAEPPSPDVR